MFQFVLTGPSKPVRDLVKNRLHLAGGALVRFDQRHSVVPTAPIPTDCMVRQNR